MTVQIEFVVDFLNPKNAIKRWVCEKEWKRQERKERGEISDGRYSSTEENGGKTRKTAGRKERKGSEEVELQIEKWIEGYL